MLWLCPDFRFHLVPTIFLPRLSTIHELILLGLVVTGRQELLHVLLYLERTFSCGFLRGKIILGHLAQRMLQSISRDTGENSPTARVQQDRICSEPLPIPRPEQQTYLQLRHLGHFPTVPFGRGAGKCYKSFARISLDITGKYQKLLKVRGR